MRTSVRLDYEQWVKEFQPVVVNEGGRDINKYLIEGENIALQGPLHRADPACVWSFVEGDGIEGIVEGVCEDSSVIGYLVTKVPAAADTSYDIDYFIEGPEPDWDEIDPALLY